MFGRVGIEFEFATRTRGGGALSERMIRSALEGALGEEVIDSREANWRHSDGTLWDIKTDSSAGWEVATPALRLDEFGRNAQIVNALAALNSAGAVVTERCGTHQHHDAPDWTWRELQRFLALWARYEPFFFELQPQSRRSNSYCLPIFRGTWGEGGYSPALVGALAATREETFTRHARGLGRSAVNLAHWWRTNRIEIRLHSGTLNATKTLNWAMLMKAVMGRVTQSDMPEIELSVEASGMQPVSTEYICKQLGLLPSRYKSNVPDEAVELVRWLKARRIQFNPHSPDAGGPQGGARGGARQSGTITGSNNTITISDEMGTIPTEAITQALRSAAAADRAARINRPTAPGSIAERMLQREHAEQLIHFTENNAVPLSQRCRARVGSTFPGTGAPAERQRAFYTEAGALDEPLRCPRRVMNGFIVCEAHHTDMVQGVPTRETRSVAFSDPVPRSRPCQANIGEIGGHESAIIERNTVPLCPNGAERGYRFCADHLTDWRRGAVLRETRPMLGVSNRSCRARIGSSIHHNGPAALLSDGEERQCPFNSAHGDVLCHVHQRDVRQFVPFHETRLDRRCRARIGSNMAVDGMSALLAEDEHPSMGECLNMRQDQRTLCAQHVIDIDDGRPFRDTRVISIPASGVAPPPAPVRSLREELDARARRVLWEPELARPARPPATPPERPPEMVQLRDSMTRNSTPTTSLITPDEMMEHFQRMRRNLADLETEVRPIIANDMDREDAER